MVDEEWYGEDEPGSDDPWLDPEFTGDFELDEDFAEFLEYELGLTEPDDGWPFDSWWDFFDEYGADIPEADDGSYGDPYGGA